MKKLLVSLFCAAGLLTASAADNYLHIKTADGWRVLDLEQVDRLTFDGNTMTASDASGATVVTIPQKSLEVMAVTETAGVSAPVIAEAKASFVYSPSTKCVTMLDDALFEMYALDGSRLVAVNAAKGENIHIDAVKAGVVIMKSGEYSIKAVVE